MERLWLGSDSRRRNASRCALFFINIEFGFEALISTSYSAESKTFDETPEP